jgi:hypothetical protein
MTFPAQLDRIATGVEFIAENGGGLGARLRKGQPV